jgi:thiamine-monophosphate kinase
MKQRDLSEKELIAAIKKTFNSPDDRVLLGIGDDAAVLSPGNLPLAATKDLLIQGIHFFSDHPPFLLGRKSLSVNLSDLAAMGMWPQYALLGLGIPQDTEADWIDQFINGLKSIASESDVSIVGGDITRAPQIFISITLLGEGKNYVTRGGARSGDSLFVSGTLGDAAQGLRLAEQGVVWGDGVESDYFLKAFFDPIPQVDLGRRLAAHKVATAMIDTSDGLSVDLRHVCEASGIGAEVEIASLPISAALSKALASPEELALHGGEDYQLLFTVAPEVLENLTRIPLGHKVTRIGRIVDGSGLDVIGPNGQREPLTPKGFQHF